MSQTYLEFYRRTYAPYLTEARLIGGNNPVGMFESEQPAGDYPDAACSTYNLQLNLGAVCRANADLGVGSVWIGLVKGEFCVGPPETEANYEVVTRSHLLGLGLPKSVVENAAAYLGIDEFNPEPLLRSGHSDPVIRQLMRECWDQGVQDSPRGALYLDANLMGIAVRIVAIASGMRGTAASKRVKELSPKALDQIAQYVDSNVDTGMRVGTLAAIVGMGDYAFARAFRISTGLPPHQWVIERKLMRATQMLRDDRLSVADIAYSLGFSSQAHLTALFSRRMGMGPASYRRTITS